MESLIRELLESNRKHQISLNKNVTMITNILGTVEEIKVSVQAVEKKIDSVSDRLTDIEKKIASVSASA